MEEVPIYQKVNLTIKEATALTNIGRDKLNELINERDCNFTLQVGRKTLIKRKLFEEYLMKKSVI